MRYYYAAGLLLFMVLFVGGTCIAENGTTQSPSPESRWIGTFTDVNYSLSIGQNGSEISGIAHTFSPDLNDPFTLNGTVSDDESTLYGVTNDTGTLEMHLSDDQMSFTGNGTVNPVDSFNTLSSYTTTGKRVGSITPGSIWAGEWVTNNSSITLTQSGDTVTGEYHALLYPAIGGITTGTVSKDGKTLSMVWIAEENVTFVLSKDGMNIIESNCSEEKNIVEYCLNLTRNG